MMSGLWALRFLLLFVLSAGSLCQSEALASVPAIDISELQFQPIRDLASFWVTDEEVSVDRLPIHAFRPLTPAQLNRGITARHHWVRVRLSNARGDVDRHWVLHHETSYLDEMLVHYADNGGSVARVLLSDRAPMALRPVQYRSLAFAHTTPAGGYTDLWLRMGFVKADTLTLNVLLSDARVFEERSRFEYLNYGVYYGLMLTLLVIAVLFAFTLRQSIFIHYAAFLGTSIVMWGALNGFAFQYLWPDSVFLHNEGFNIGFLLMSMAALQFSRSFLRTAELFPFVNKLIRVSQWVMGAGILVRLAGVYGPVLYLSYLGLASLILLAPLGYMAYRKGLRYARWYAAAWVIYGIGLLLSVLSAGSSLFSWGMTPLVFAQAGGALEALFLLVALGEKLAGWERDRRLALAVANQDPLTGLGNRRALEKAYGELTKSFSGRGMRVYLVLIDLDLFKTVNDCFGHDCGDEVLRHLGRILRRTSRSEDVCVRFGGEEFIVLLEVSTLEQALDVAERIRTEFARTPTLYQGNCITHTLTAGIAEAMTQERMLTLREAIKQADQALYAAKNAGRDQTRAHGQA